MLQSLTIYKRSMQKTGLIDSQKPCNYQLERSRTWLYSYSVGNSDRETDPVSNDVENSNIEGHLFIYTMYCFSWNSSYRCGFTKYEYLKGWLQIQSNPRYLELDGTG